MNQNCPVYPTTIQQGATYVLTVQYLDSEQVPIDITDYDAEMQVRVTAESDEVLVEASVDDGRITIDGVTGTLVITIPASVTEALEAPFNAVYDLKITSPTDVVTRLLEGAVYISPSVTR